jgi:excinuclease ABC subunit A
MTDIASYLNLLFATIGQSHCPRTGEPTPSRSASQILEGILSLPAGAEIELRAPAFKVYGEELDFVFTELRKKGCRQLIVDGTLIDLSAEIDVDESQVRNIDAIVDRFVVGRKHEKAIKAGIASTLLVGDGLLQIHVTKGASKSEVHITSCTATSRRRTLSSTTRKAPVGPAVDWESTSSPIPSC